MERGDTTCPVCLLLSIISLIFIFRAHFVIQVNAYISLNRSVFVPPVEFEILKFGRKKNTVLFIGYCLLALIHRARLSAVRSRSGKGQLSVLNPF